METTLKMKTIQMVDLRGQYEKIKESIDAAVLNVIRSAQFIHGPDVRLLEEELSHYLNVKHVIACANGTDALKIALLALDLKPGDEVITPTFTFISTAEVVGLLGLHVVFADSDSRTFTLDPGSIKKAITGKTRAIIPVHLYGQCSNMEEIMKIAQEHNLFVIEDNAQAIGADYTFSDRTGKKAGTIGHIGTTSFFPSKNLGAYGDAGALFTNEDGLAEKLRMIANHGQKSKYYFELLGMNSRLDSMQAAILRVKLKELDKYISARRKAAAYYDTHLSKNEKITVPYHDPSSTHVFHQYTIKLNGVDRDGLQDVLKKNGIPSVVYYPLPLHLHKAFSKYGFRKGDFPVSEHLCGNILSLPMHTELDEEQLEYITDAVLQHVGS